MKPPSRCGSSILLSRCPERSAPSAAEAPARAVAAGDCCFVHVHADFVDCGDHCCGRDRSAGDSVRKGADVDFEDCTAGLADIAAAVAGFRDSSTGQAQLAERPARRTKEEAGAIESLQPAG